MSEKKNQTIHLNDLKKMIPQDQLESYLKEAKELEGRDIISESSTQPLENLQSPKEIQNKLLQNNVDDAEKKRNELRAKLRQKTNQMSQSRQSKDIQMKNQLEMMKDNPMFSNALQGTQEDKKKIIDMYASSVTKDSKQKKNIKKQMEKIMNNADLVI